MQGWSLEKKIKVSQMKILEWYREYNGQVFTSFSGGKDSTVLLDLARQVCPDIPAVYVDTGLEYPELRDFVKTKDNVIWLRPRYPFTQIIEKYGYPVISKEVSDVINGARKGQPYRLARLNGELLDKNGRKSIDPAGNVAAEETETAGQRHTAHSQLLGVAAGDNSGDQLGDTTHRHHLDDAEDNAAQPHFLASEELFDRPRTGLQVHLTLATQFHCLLDTHIRVIVRASAHILGVLLCSQQDKDKCQSAADGHNIEAAMESEEAPTKRQNPVRAHCGDIVAHGNPAN